MGACTALTCLRRQPSLSTHTLMNPLSTLATTWLAVGVLSAPLATHAESAQPGSKPGPTPPSTHAPVPAAANVRLKRHTFPDITMGGVTSHSVILPDGWTSSGKTEWSTGNLPYPQNSFEIRSPDGGRIRFVPALHLGYTEMNPANNLTGIPPQGVPAPQDFPQWLAAAKQQTRPPVSNVTLIDSKRQTAIEAMHDRTQRETGALDNGMIREAWLVTLEYDEAGSRRREEALMLYVRYAPILNQNIRSQQWSVFTTSVISAPRDEFDRLKGELSRVAGSVRPTPQWWTQSQALLAELQRIRTDARWNEIRRRGERINQMTDADYAKYKKSFANDSTQRDRINAIYETSDYRDSTGDIVNLPMHYKNVYSDGAGHYVLTNDTRDRPGESWNAIEPVK